MMDLSDEIRFALHDLIIQCANDAKEPGILFAKSEAAIGRQHPKGLKAHLEEVVFEKKKEIKKEVGLGTRWINSGCPSIFDRKVIKAIIEHTYDIFTWNRERNSKFAKKWNTDLETDEEMISDIQKFHLKPFFKIIREIQALEDLIKESEINDSNGLTLWDLFIDEKKANIIKSNLIKNGRIRQDGGKMYFVPVRGGALKEACTLYHVLCCNHIKNDLLDAQVVKILSNTFEGFKCSTKTFYNGKNGDKTNYYFTLCKLD